jgi:hypothetical protein
VQYGVIDGSPGHRRRYRGGVTRRRAAAADAGRSGRPDERPVRGAGPSGVVVGARSGPGAGRPRGADRRRRRGDRRYRRFCPCPGICQPTTSTNSNDVAQYEATSARRAAAPATTSRTHSICQYVYGTYTLKRVPYYWLAATLAALHGIEPYEVLQALAAERRLPAPARSADLQLLGIYANPRRSTTAGHHPAQPRLRLVDPRGAGHDRR